MANYYAPGEMGDPWSKASKEMIMAKQGNSVAGRDRLQTPRRQSPGGARANYPGSNTAAAAGPLSTAAYQSYLNQTFTGVDGEEDSIQGLEGNVNGFNKDCCAKKICRKLNICDNKKKVRLNTPNLWRILPISFVFVLTDGYGSCLYY